MRILAARADRPRPSGWIFFIAWLIGAVALAGGLEGLQGLRENLFVVGAFAIACAAWWGACRMSNFRSRGGLVVIALRCLIFFLGIVSATSASLAVSPSDFLARIK